MEKGFSGVPVESPGAVMLIGGTWSWGDELSLL